MTIRLLALYLLACTLGCGSCATVQPVPDQPGDVLAGRTYDCTEIDTRVTQNRALACAALADLPTCMVELSRDAGEPDAVCGARDAQVAIFIRAAQGTASDDEKARAENLRAWLLAEKVQLRN
jgi:hypothetical protein